MSHLTDFIRRETPHLTGVVIDGSIGVLTPTLVYFVDGAKTLVAKGDDAWSSWILLLGSSGVVALTALGAFRSQTYGRWKEDSTKRKAEEEQTRLTHLG